MDRIIRMVINQVIRQLVNRGVKAGFDKVGQRGKGQGGDAPKMTPEERREHRQARRAAKAAKQQMQVARKVTRL